MSYMLSFLTKSEPVLPDSLSDTERLRGQRLYLRFSTLNGISVACLMDSILILFAIRNQLADPLVAVMASFIYITMPFMVVGKSLAARTGVARAWALGWGLRYVSALLMVAAPSLRGWLPPSAISGMILTGAFGFALFRSVGSVGHKPLAGEVTSVDDRGRFLSGSSMRINASHLVTMLVIIVWFRYTERMWVYQAILAIGCLVGLYASTILARIPESAMPRLSARRSLRESARHMWGHADRRLLLFAWCAGLASFSLILPVMMIAVKNGYLISDYAALSFSMIVLLGAVLISLVNGVLAQRHPPRILILIYLGGSAAVAAYWAFAPSGFEAFSVAFSFLLAGACKTGIMIALNHYFLEAVDDSRRVGTTLVVQILSGAIAGLAGAVLGGGLLKLLADGGLQGLAVYRAYFKIILILVLAAWAVMRANLVPAGATR